LFAGKPSGWGNKQIREHSLSIDIISFSREGDCVFQRRHSDDRLTQFSHRVSQIKFIVFEIGMLVVFLAGVYAVVTHELGIR